MSVYGRTIKEDEIMDVLWCFIRFRDLHCSLRTINIIRFNDYQDTTILESDRIFNPYR